MSEKTENFKIRVLNDADSENIKKILKNVF
jgi:hypothetical protein